MIESLVQSMIDEADLTGERVLVAVSGGRDSVVLLDLLGRCAARNRLEIVVGHVNHGLRGAASNADAAFVEALAKTAGFAFRSEQVDPEADRAGGPSRERPSLEEAARNQRRAALLRMADATDCRAVALAHHAGDQAETLLLRLLRGTGPDGLSGMAPVSGGGRIVRPLLAAEPDQIAAWAELQRLEWREDASNQDRRFTRNRLRLDWIPELARTFNPNLLQTFRNFADATRADAEWIEELVAEAAKERLKDGPDGIQLVLDGWEALPEALARRVLRRALLELDLGRDLTRAHLDRVLAFVCRGRRAGRDKRIELPRGIVLSRCSEYFLLSPADP